MVKSGLGGGGWYENQSNLTQVPGSGPLRIQTQSMLQALDSKQGIDEQNEQYAGLGSAAE